MTILERIKERVAGSRLARKRNKTVTYGEYGAEIERSRCVPEGEILFFKELGTDSRIEFYENGVVKYYAHGDNTKFPIDSCTEITYKHYMGTVTIDENELQGEEAWLWRYIIEGENRIMDGDEYNAQYGIFIRNMDGKYRREHNLYYQQMLEDNDKLLDKLLRSEDRTIADYDLFDDIKDYLTEKQYRVLELYYKEGLSLQDIADIMGVTFQAIFNIKAAAIKRLKLFLFNSDKA